MNIHNLTQEFLVPKGSTVYHHPLCTHYNKDTYECHADPLFTKQRTLGNICSTPNLKNLTNKLS